MPGDKGVPGTNDHHPSFRICLIPSQVRLPTYARSQRGVSTGLVERTMLMRTQEPSGNSSSSSVVHRLKEAKPIVIDNQHFIFSLAFLVDAKHVVSSGEEGKIRRWRTEDGKEVGVEMDAGNFVFSVAVSRDGRWIVSGTVDGVVTVWSAKSHSKVTEFRAHGEDVGAVDVSPDATKIATGSNDCTVCVWSLSTGERLLGPLQHNYWVVAAKFSPDGRLIATATYKWCDSVRVYDSQDGSLLVDFPVRVHSWLNYTLAWANDSTQLFALSHDGCILRLDVSAKTTLSKWHIHTSNDPNLNDNHPMCIALASNGTFIAASAGSSVSFWNTTSQKQIGTVINYTHHVASMAMSTNCDLVTNGGKQITLRTLIGTLPSPYVDNVSNW